MANSSSMIKLPNAITSYTTFQNNVIFKKSCAVSEVSLQSKNVLLATIKHSSSDANTLVIRPTEKVVYREESEDCRVASFDSLSQRWREVQGCDDWEGLVAPLHPLLQQEVIRYGEFLVACYNAFDLDPKSSRYLNCKYGKKSMLKEVGMEKCGYEITKYIYATPDMSGIPVQGGRSYSTCGRWIGYVSVSSDEESKRLGRRDVLVTFRGTVTNPEWITNLMSSLTPARLDPHNPRTDVMVESGLLSLYTSDECSSKFGMCSCREQLLSEISRLVTKYKGDEMSITVAGHSMGSSLGLLLAYDVAELGLNLRERNQPIPITLLSFAGPRVGNAGFKTRLEELGVKVLRIVNVNDPITKLPGIIFNENFRAFGSSDWFEFSCYAHVGVELALDFFDMENPCCVHDLGTYINLLRYPMATDRRTCVSRSTDCSGIVGDIMSKAREVVSCASSFDMSLWMVAAATIVQLQQMIGL
ncbi:unnamed protein product [Rhodiola kirilowii]